MMEISHIPKSFWHAMSFCMVAATLGLLYIAYFSSSVSIEIANAKIELSSAIYQAKNIKNDLAEENDRLVEANTLMSEKIRKLEEKATRSSVGISLQDLQSYGISGDGSNNIKRLMRDSVNSTWERDIEAKIQSAERTLTK